MYFDYLKERENLDSIQTDFGFISYKIVDDECYLANMYLKPEFRGSSKFKEIMAELEKTALSNGCKTISANIHLIDKGATRALKAAFKLDFFIVKAEHNIIVIVKHLGG